MNLSFAVDFTSSVDLDSQLLSTPDSGIYWNRGVHPVLTVSNLLTFLPYEDITFSDWDIGITYNKFETTQIKTDVVTYDGNIYQSLTNTNLGNQPDTSTANWLLTNIESLRIKAFIFSAEKNAISALSLSRKLIENQYIYNVGETVVTLDNDYSGWVFEPKGSDYVKIRINQIALQANTTTPQSLYVVNQGVLIDTLTLNPNNGILEFEDVGYTISGKGVFKFVIESQEVLSNGAFNDALKYDGFVCYPISGTGATPEGADYNTRYSGNGMNFNVSCYLDSSIYFDNNKIDFSKFIQSQFEYDYIRMVLHNANNTSTTEQRIQTNGVNKQLLATETLNIDMATVARKYNEQLKIALTSINKTFDKFITKPAKFTVKRKTI